MRDKMDGWVGGRRWENGQKGEGEEGECEKREEKKTTYVFKNTVPLFPQHSRQKHEGKGKSLPLAPVEQNNWGGERERTRLGLSPPHWFWPLGITQLWPPGLYLHTWRALETRQSGWRMLMSSSWSLWRFNVCRIKETIWLCCLLI